jgi:flavin reductase (DIM6/NTAB) family NADH-FMN oxidoreductase RutF
MLSSVVTGPHQTIVIGRVLAVHIDDACVLDAGRAHINTPALNLVARSYGSTYVRSKDTFELKRPNWAEWSKANPKQK